MSFLIDDFASDYLVIYEHKVPNNLPKVQYLVKCKQSSTKTIVFTSKLFKIKRHKLFSTTFSLRLLEFGGMVRTYLFCFDKLQQAATVSRVDRSEVTLYCHQSVPPQFKKSLRIPKFFE